MQHKKTIPYLSIIVTTMSLMTLSLSALALKDDRTKPITITADSAERDGKLGTTLYQGNVVIRQGSILIEADIVTIKTRISPVTTREELEEIVAIGQPSHLQQQLETNNEIVDAVSTTIHYEVSTDAVSFIENAVLKQGERVVKGDRITYNIAAQKVIAGSEKTGEKASDRVTVTIPPKQTPSK
jgi:lipopolysaccharide export system protein LptA